MQDMDSESSSVALISAVISALVAFLVLFIDRWLSHVTSRRDLRRRGLEEWLSSLAMWVDEHRGKPHDQASDKLMEKYQQLTNRQILEFRFKRKDRYVAWWMHEMVLALLDEEPTPNNAGYRDTVLRDTGESLLKWHHGELKSKDFDLPYGLRKAARVEKRTLQELAPDLKLSEFIEPRRMTLRHQWHMIKLMSAPETGEPILTSIGPFVSKNHVMQGRRVAIFNATMMVVKSVPLELRRRQLQRQAAKIKRRLAALQAQEEVDERSQEATESSEPPHEKAQH